MNTKQLIRYFFLFSLFSTVAFAADDLSESNLTTYTSAEQYLDSVKLEKKQIENMIDKMIASGRISKEDGQKAKRELASMDEGHLDQLKDKAVNEIKSKNLLNKQED
jgi:polyhydroxyalkanoate synthesis regulator phasin